MLLRTRIEWPSKNQGYSKTDQNTFTRERLNGYATIAILIIQKARESADQIRIGQCAGRRQGVDQIGGRGWRKTSAARIGAVRPGGVEQAKLMTLDIF